MASKYKDVVKKLKPYEEESDFQMKVNKWKSEYAVNTEDANISHLGANLESYKQIKKELEERISVINVALEAISQMLVQSMQCENIEKFTLSNGSTCYMSYEVYPSIKDKAALIEWAKKHHMADSLTFPWQTLRGLCNDLSVEGKPMPKGVETFGKMSARIRKNGDG